MAYTYEHDGLLATETFSNSTVTPGWQSTYDYDNLGQLISWIPDAGMPKVHYYYDGNGNLTKRQWNADTLNNETTTYSFDTSSRTAVCAMVGTQRPLTPARSTCGGA